MSLAAIQVAQLGKQYLLGERRASYRTLRDTIASMATGMTRRRKVVHGNSMFWALKDVSFSVRQGQVLGIVGRNGAGKSTLLKLLSRITEPTEGWADIRGRIGSLLEVGTGFHPELTGRENVFLNGAILGMKKAEVNRKFDSMVAFAEIEPFIDTPVKHYSSGMYLRLAFAVAAHLEPEILLVDEVLAVGDATFQRKCIAKMSSVARQGSTVLLVSHNLGVVQEICDEAILLDEGRLTGHGPAIEVVELYLRRIEGNSKCKLEERTDRRGVGNNRLTRLDISAPGAEGGELLIAGKPARIRLDFSGQARGLACTFTIYNQHGQAVVNFRSDVPSPADCVNGAFFVCDLDEVLLVPGRYRVNVALVRGDILEDHVEGAATFVIEPGTVRGRRIGAADKYGMTVIPHRWTVPAC